MSRFTTNGANHAPIHPDGHEDIPVARQKHHFFGRNIPPRGEEVDEEMESEGTNRSHGVNPPQLRFYPHRFPLPKMLLGVLTVIGGALLIGALFFQVEEVVTPFMLVVLATLLLYPFRSEPKLRPLIVVAAVLFLSWFVAKSIMVLVPFLVAFLLAYTVEPLVTKLQRKFYVKRWISALVATLVLVGLLAVGIFYMIPILVAQVGNTLGSLDKVLANLINWAHSGGLASLTGMPQDKVNSIVDHYLVPKTAGLENTMMKEAESVAAALPAFLSSALHFLMIPFLMFYFIKDYWRIRAAIYSFIPQEYQRRTKSFLRDLDEVVGGFLRGDVITSIFQGTFIGVGLHFIGVPGALLLGVLTAFLTLIPFIGGVTAYALAAFAALYMPEPGLSLLYVTILFVAQSILESTVIGPQIMGRHTDLHALVIIFAILIFGFFGGVGGMLVAIPVTGLLLRFAMRWRTRRHAEIEEEKVQADLARNPHHAKKGEELPEEVMAGAGMAGPKGPLPR